MTIHDGLVFLYDWVVEGLDTLAHCNRPLVTFETSVTSYHRNVNKGGLWSKKPSTRIHVGTAWENHKRENFVNILYATFYITWDIGDEYLFYQPI